MKKSSPLPYQEIYETSRDAILLLDRSHCFECNPATLFLFGVRDKMALLCDSRPASREGLPAGFIAFYKYEEAIITAMFHANFLFEWSFVNSENRRITLETSIRAFEQGDQTIIMANVRDISIRIHQQAIISDNEARYRELIANLRDGVMILSHNQAHNDFKIVAINKTVEEIENRPAQELIDKNLQDVFPFIKTHILYQTLHHVFLSRIPENLVYHFSAHDEPDEAERSWRDASIFCLPNNEVVIVYRDITLQRQVENEIIKLSQAVKQSPAIIIITDKNGRIEYVNPKFTEISGYEIEEVLHKNPKMFGSGDTDKTVYQELWQTISCGETWRGEFINRRKNGEIYTEGASITPIKDNTGQISHYLAIKQDITDRKKAQTLIKDSEEKFRTLFEESQDMIYICSPEGDIIKINHAGVEMLGYASKQELLKDSLKSHYQDQTLWNEKIDILRFTKGLKDLETVMIRQDGSVIEVTESVNAIYNTEKELVGLRGIVRDVTEKVKRTRELEAINDELNTANLRIKETQSQLIQQEKLASIGNLAAGIAHELNNPLGFVSSNFVTLQKYNSIFVDYMAIWQPLYGSGLQTHEIQNIIAQAKAFRQQKQLDFIQDDLKDLFTESREGFSRMSSIVENMRSFSRIDQNNSMAPYDINQGIENTLIVARNEIKYVADVNKELADITPFLCRGDQINQVLLNIIVNSAQAIKGQERKDRGTITIRTRQVEEYVICEIKDDGPGIPEHVIGHVFDPFFTTKKVGEGTGLGLNISYDIVVNKHKGSLSVESPPGAGALFTIAIPQRIANQEEALE